MRALLLILFFSFLIVIESKCQCTAEAGNAVTICSGNPVNLGGSPTAVNAGGGVTYTWTNITGANATVSNPTVSPATTTTYQVTLNGGGCNNVTDQVTVTVLPSPNASFTFSPNNACANNAVGFVNTSTTCTGCQFSWNFNDPASGAGNTSTSSSPDHLFQAFGSGNQTFAVTLTITAANNCTSTATQNVVVKQIPNIQLQDPINNFTQCSGDNTFNLSVYDASTPATNTSYGINWGDGTPSWTGSAAPQGLSHLYTTNDVFDLIYTITGTNGCVATETVYVSNITNPSIGAANPGGTQGCGPLNICFPLNNYANNHSSTTYTVDFGDGSPQVSLTHPPPAQICHSYTGSSCPATGGAYTFTITANNNCDVSVATITPVRVYTGPQAAFTASPVPQCVNSSITFTNTSVLGYNNQCNQNTLFTWSWGDNSANTVVTTTAAQSHAYSTPGTYTVTLSAQNSCGTSTVSQQVCIEAPPVASFSVTGNTGCVPFAINTTNNSTQANACNVVRSWNVAYSDLPCDPDDGTYSYTAGTTASSAQPSFLFSSVGVYTISLSLTNSCGVFTDNESITVNTVPVIALSAISSVCSGTSVTPSANVDGCNLSVTNYSWTMTGGTPSTSNLANPGSVLYNTPGNYSISLTASNACGPAVASTNFVVAAPPNVQISSSDSNNSICYNTPFTLTATGASSFTWSSGPSGGLQSTIGNSVTAIPTGNATYTVLGNSGTCTDQETISIVVTSLPVVNPGGTFSMCQGQNLQISAVASGGTPPYSSWVWSNPGTLSNNQIANPISTTTSSTLYIVQVNDANGCTGVGTVPVTVNPPPVVSAGPDTQLCNQPVGTQLTGMSPTGGTWSGNAQVTSSGLFTPANVGCVTLTYTYTDPTTTCTGTDNVQVCVTDPTPANGGPDINICLNDPPLNLPATGTWTGCNVVNNVFTPSTAGPCTLTFTQGTGSCATTDQVVITVRSRPTVNAGPDQTVCAGSLVQLNASATPASGSGPITLYSWSGATVSNSIINNPTFNPNQTVTLNVTAVDSYSCSNQDQITIFVNPLPVVDAGADFTACNQPVAVDLPAATPAGGVWTGTGVSGGQFTPSGVGQFTATYTYTNPVTTCVNTDQVLITVSNATVANGGADVQLCLNQGVYTLVPVTPGGTWSPAAIVTSGGTFDPSSTGNYTLTYTLGSGSCETTDQVLISVNPLPLANAGVDHTICAGNAVALNGSANGGTPPYQYAWQPSNSLNNSAIANPQANPLSTTTYTLVVTDSKQCSASDQSTVTVNPLPIVFAGNDISVCNQPIAQVLTGFSPTTGGTGTWTGQGIINPSGSFQSPGLGVYTVYYSFTAQATGCTNNDSIQVTVVDPIPSIAGPDHIICLNNGPLQLDASPAPPVGQWTGTGISTSTPDTFDPVLSGVGTFTLTLQTGSGTCATSDQTVVTVRPLPNVQISGDTILCGNALPFAQSGFTPSSGGIWEGIGVLSASSGLFDPAIGAGTYPLLFHFTDPATGCADTAFKVITISPVPVANFSLAPLGCTNAPVNAVNTSIGGTSFSWSFGNGIELSGFNPSYTYPTEGSFDVELIAFNTAGCSDTANNANVIIAPPVANFSVNPQQGCAPLQVTFQNNSVGQQMIFNWDYSIGTTQDSIPSPQTYPQGDDVVIYPVTLTATNFCGTSSDDENITVYPRPVAGFGTNLDEFCSPFTVLFNDISTGNPDTYLWDFGDGSSLFTGPEPVSHVFFADTIPVQYTIWMHLENECGTDSASYTITVLPNTVTSFFNTNVTEGCSPLAVEFTDYSDGATQIWYNLGDNTTDSNDNPTHIYNTPGDYCIYQYADNGCSYDTSVTCIVVYESPQVDFTVDAPFICQDNFVQFHSITSGAVELLWDFDDGNSSTNSDPSHVFATGQVFDVSLTGTSDNGCTATATHPFTVYPSPVANFTVPELVGCSPFNVCASNGTAGGNFYSWDFGDGNTSALYNPCYTYTNDTDAPILRTIRLIAQNAQLCADTLSVNVVVSPQPVSAFTLSAPSSCYFPVTVTATNESIYANSFSWQIDGTEVSQNQYGSFTFQDVGNYNVTLEVSNPYGCTNTSSAPFAVNPLPAMEFDATPLSGCVPLNVNFTNMTTGAASFEWSFGDGNTSTAFSPSHLYSTTGIFDVAVIAETDLGCRDTLTYANMISVYNNPVANFTITPPTADIYNPNFTFVSNGFDSHAWQWDFGDGVFSNNAIAKHGYEEAGMYVVNLVVSNEHGCRDTIEKTVTIEDRINVYVPNTFTPDGDGINEVFLPFVTGMTLIASYKFEIFDRWGTVIFSTDDPKEPWLGNVRGGDYYAKEEVYNWKITLLLKGTDEKRIKQGVVFLLR